jgi:23S rRNA pseudouridine1911/1915/1917 synthase
MTHLGHSLICDPVYGRSKLTQKFSKHVHEVLTGFEKQALHARTLGFLHPKTGNYVLTKAPLPEDLQELITCLDLPIGIV